MADEKGFETKVLERIEAQLDPLSEAAAGLMGMPPGGKTYTRQDQLTLWNSSPIATPQARVEAMLTMKAQGATDEQITDAIYPERRRLITTSRPKIQDQISFAKSMTKLMEQEAAKVGMSPLPEPGVGLQAQSPTVPASMPAPMMDAPPAMPVQQPAPMAAPAAPPSMLDTPISMLGG